MSSADKVLALCVALTPSQFKAVREEQWRADLRDGPGLGISTSSLLFGALCSSITARFYEAINRGSFLLSQLTRGKNMKVLLVMSGLAAVLAAGAVVGVQAVQPKTEYPRPEAMTIAGYEGWWNSTPASGNTEGLPQETVAVNTRTGKIVDASNRARNDAGLPTLPSDVNFDVVPDPNWPANSIVIIDTASGKVIEDFVVDEKGSAYDQYGQPYQPKNNF
ncbi:hypothetical protein [Pseudarthrobacter sp. NamE5]|uniref:hypothetical protein n=1 Tax=Pseudarthrobacter sp. NamE5 TaxID=2576839 RepID=UPI00110A3FE9|nr:hypothetical protein [Pseudarthrobacter sp. NamE5]TLM80868.1 hypothetical protein FDW84_18675 [Pseudarthrobacter sp. NamE5]